MPPEWTDGAWLAFEYFGPPGLDEAWHKPEAAARIGTVPGKPPVSRAFANARRRSAVSDNDRIKRMRQQSADMSTTTGTDLHEVSGGQSAEGMSLTKNPLIEMASVAKELKTSFDSSLGTWQNIVDLMEQANARQTQVDARQAQVDKGKREMDALHAILHVAPKDSSDYVEAFQRLRNIVAGI